MSVTRIIVREGTSDPITFQVLSDGVVVNLTGIQKAELKLKDRNGTITTFATTDVPSKLVISDATNGKLRFDRTTSDFLNSKSPYYAVILITDSAGKISSYPEASDLIIYVSPSV